MIRIATKSRGGLDYCSERSHAHLPGIAMNCSMPLRKRGPSM
jgi:hypothetical protein